MHLRADRIMRSKMADYAGEQAFSGNFRRSATANGLTALQVWGVLADKHWGAITSFIRKGQLESEPIQDRIADLINYLHLLNGIIEEDKVGCDIEAPAPPEIPAWSIPEVRPVHPSSSF